MVSWAEILFSIVNGNEGGQKPDLVTASIAGGGSTAHGSIAQLMRSLGCDTVSDPHGSDFAVESRETNDQMEELH